MASHVLSVYYLDYDTTTNTTTFNNNNNNKESEKKDKYLDLARELKKYGT